MRGGEFTLFTPFHRAFHPVNPFIGKGLRGMGEKGEICFGFFIPEKIKINRVFFIFHRSKMAKRISPISPCDSKRLILKVFGRVKWGVKRVKRVKRKK